jgi:hypothetical protein
VSPELAKTEFVPETLSARAAEISRGTAREHEIVGELPPRFLMVRQQNEFLAELRVCAEQSRNAHLD